MKSLTLPEIHERAIAGTHEDFKWTRNGRTTMNYLNPKTGGTESWDVTSLPLEELHAKITIFVRYAGRRPDLLGMEGRTNGAEEGGLVLVRWGTRIDSDRPDPPDEWIALDMLTEIRRFTKNFW